MLIDMWRTTKRQNSTATPVSQPGWFTQHVQKEVSLKEPTSVLNPVFTLKMGGHDGQNYLWAFGRYYWITGITSLAKDLWEIQCKVDVLGSYRGHIRNTQAFVLYDSTPNSEIPDRRLGVHTTATYSHSQTAMPWNFLLDTGTKYVCIDGDGQNEDQASSTGVYQMTDAAINDLGYQFETDFMDTINDAFDEPLYEWNGTKVSYRAMAAAAEDDLDTATTTMESIALYISWIPGLVACFAATGFYGLYKAIKGLFTSGDALKHVKSAYWIPFVTSKGTDTSVNKITLGSWVEDINAIKIVDPIVSTTGDISIPWQYSDWRNVSNTEIQLFIPLIGNINIPSSAVKGQNTINLYFGLNRYSGAFAVRVRCGGATLGSYGCNCSSPILIGDSNVNAGAITNTVVGAIGVAAGAATGGAALAVGGAIASVASGFESLVPINTSVGGIGGGIASSLGHQIWCTTICHNTSDNPADLLPIIGTPTNVLKTLSGTGFCQCMQAHMNMQAVVGESFPTASEVTEVDSLLNSGVFLE